MYLVEYLGTKIVAFVNVRLHRSREYYGETLFAYTLGDTPEKTNAFVADRYVECGWQHMQSDY